MHQLFKLFLVFSFAVRAMQGGFIYPAIFTITIAASYH